MDSVPLSFAQEQVWLTERLFGGDTAYHVPVAFRLVGDLDLSALRRALERLIERHEVLRTGFPAVDGVPVQEIWDAGETGDPPLSLVPLPGGAKPEEWIAEQLRAIVAEPFDLAGRSLLRARLLVLEETDQEGRRSEGARDSVLVIVVHHIVCDGPSIPVLVRELAQLYAVAVADRPDGLRALPIQFADYAAWQREQAASGRLDVHASWWRARLQGVSGTPDLLPDRPRPALPTHAGARHLEPLDDLVWSEVSSLGRRHRTTPFTILLAACAAWLSDWSGVDDVVIGSPIAARDRAEVEPLIGMLTTMLPFRIRIDRDAGFGRLVDHVRGVTLAALEHSEVPQEYILDDLRLPRDPSRHPLIGATFAYQPDLPVVPELPGLTVTPVEIPTTTSKFDLTLAVEAAETSRRLCVVYRSELFEPATIGRTARRYLDLLATLLAQPGTPLRRWLRTGAGRVESAGTPLRSAVAVDHVRPDTAGRTDGADLMRWLTAQWRAVLGLDVGHQISPETNFFDLGGSSALMAQVHARLVEHLGMGPEADLPLITLYRYPTVAGLAGHLTSTWRGEATERRSPRWSTPATPTPASAPAPTGRRTTAAGRDRRRRLAGGRPPSTMNQTSSHPRRASGDITMDEACVHHLVERHSAMHPERPALAEGRNRLTYGELDARAGRVAARLVRSGTRPDEPIGLFLPRSTDFVVAALGVLKAGAAYLPLDPRYPEGRIRAMIDAARPRIVLTRERLATGLNRILPTDGTTVCIDGVGDPVDDRAGHDAGGDGTESAPRLPKVDGENLAYVMYTSGSTGDPKGVMVPHRAVVRLVDDNDPETRFTRFGPDEVFLLQSSLSFDAATYEIWGALAHGGMLVIGPQAPPSLAELGRILREESITQVFLTAGLFHLMVDERLSDLGGLTCLIAGGDALSASRVRRAVVGLPGTRLVNGYGPTECTTFAVCHQIGKDWEPSGSVPIGRPITRTTARVLDERMQLVPVGVPGQLYLGGDGLARGYLADPALSADRFVPDPFATVPGARLYATGDRARHCPDGTIEFLGRIDQQVKVRGFRVEPVEIVAALCQHPAIRDAAVLPIGDDAESRRLSAYLVLDSTGAEDDDALGTVRAWLADRLPEYLVPDLWSVLPRLPLNANGKVDTNRLRLSERELNAERASTGTASERSGGGGGDGGSEDTDQALVAAVYREVLGLDRVGPRDDFFELGGHSLLATKVAARLHRMLGVEIPTSALFDHPTVAELAAHVSARRS